MAKLAQNFAKYVIYARLNATGVVEKPDVIGAIFGQTEGLLGSELDLRELQHTGRIGRIEVNVKTDKGKSFAEIIIPSSLDTSETALIGASLETIDKVGPCDAQISVTKVDDVRTQKRKYVIERAKEILRAMIDISSPDTQKISEIVKESVRSWEVSDYHGLACGPDINTSDEIVVVEGRADVINLLKNGIRNVIAIEGSKIPQEVVNLTKEKTTTAFLDGDRGGELDLKRLLALAEIDFIARAETGKEVEELTKKQIFKSLRERVPVNQLSEKSAVKTVETIIKETAEETEDIDDKTKNFLASLLDDLIGTRAAYIIDKDMQIMSKVPISEISDIVGEYTNILAVVFDGKVNQSVVDLVRQRNIKYLVGMGFKEHVDSEGVQVLTIKDFR
ncbi:DNA primase [archaeon]|nr:DNA primase [archaeon]